MQKIDKWVVINYKTTCNYANFTDDVAKIYGLPCNVLPPRLPICNNQIILQLQTVNVSNFPPMQSALTS